MINQFPGLIPTLYTGGLATVPTPFTSIGTMWLFFKTMATNKTSALNGEYYFCLPLLAGLPL